MEAVLTNKSSKALRWVAAALSSVIGICWAVITYVFPDPSVFGLGALNWRNVLCFFAAFVFLIALWVLVMSWRLPRALTHTVSLLVTTGLCALFFIIGTEYAKPSFDFAQTQDRTIENDSPTMLGKRIVMVSGVRIEMISCRVEAQIPSCRLGLTSTNRDREVYFSSNSRIFTPNGNKLGISSLIVGDTDARYYNQFDLVRGLTTQVTVIFEQATGLTSAIPAVRLVMSGLDRNEQTISFRDVKIESNETASTL